jgi:hypothetical protein
VDVPQVFGQNSLSQNSSVRFASPVKNLVVFFFLLMGYHKFFKFEGRVLGSHPHFWRSQILGFSIWVAIQGDMFSNHSG